MVGGRDYQSHTLRCLLEAACSPPLPVIEMQGTLNRANITPEEKLQTPGLFWELFDLFYTRQRDQFGRE